MNYNKEIYSRFNINSTFLDVDSASTILYYQKIQETNNHSEIIKSINSQFQEILFTLGIDIQKPCKTNILEYKGKNEYTIEYLVYGFIVNKSSFFTYRNKMIPEVIDKQTMQFYEICQATEKPGFYISIEIIK